MKFLEALEYLRSKLGSVPDPEVALVLGSGLDESIPLISASIRMIHEAHYSKLFL